MKKFLFFLALTVFARHAADGSNPRHLSAFFSSCTFDQPGKSPYIETYLNVLGTSVKLVKNSENELQGTIEVQWVYKQNNKIVHFEKYNLLSPPLADTSQPVADFIDQQRVPLANGDYLLELKINDKNSGDPGYSTTQNISINYQPGKVNVSDIEFLESYRPVVKAGPFSKSGYDLVPLVTNYFPKSEGVLKFYAEIYNTKEVFGEDEFLVSYNISGHQTKSIVNNLVGYKKQKASTVNTVLAELPVTNVSSGNYNVCVEVRDKSNHLLASKQMLFQRSNPAEKEISLDDLSAIKIDNTFVSYMTDKDTLADYISSLYPISAQFEAVAEETQVKYNKLESMQQFFYYFWSYRNPQNPEQAWLDYKEMVNSVNAEFSCTSRKGYESDRGRVYLQYGKPNTIDKNYFEGEAYPYEIWQYNKTNDQTNVKFVFLSRNLSANCFELIHSTAKGEFYDANWETRLRTESKSNSYNGDIDRGDDYSHSRSSRDTKTNNEFSFPK